MHIHWFLLHFWWLLFFLFYSFKQFFLLGFILRHHFPIAFIRQFTNHIVLINPVEQLVLIDNSLSAAFNEKLHFLLPFLPENLFRYYQPEKKSPFSLSPVQLLWLCYHYNLRGKSSGRQEHKVSACFSYPSLLSALIVIKTGQNIKGAIGWTFYRSRHFAFAPNVRTLL